MKGWLARWDRRNQALSDQAVEDGWDAGERARQRSIDRHRLLYAVVSGFAFFAFTWGFLHFPLWFGVISGVVMVPVVWTGQRPNGWARRLFETGTTKRAPKDQAQPRKKRGV